MSGRQKARAVVVGVVGIVGLVAGCSSGGGKASETTPAAASPTSTQEAPATPTTAVANLPTDCAELGSAQTRATTVDTMQLQSETSDLLDQIEGMAWPTPQGATLAVGCDWFAGDVTDVLVLVSTATPDAVATQLGTLDGEGYTCEVSQDLGQTCILPGETTFMDMGAISTQEMVFARDGVWIYMSTSNMDGRALLSEIAASVFA